VKQYKAEMMSDATATLTKIYVQGLGDGITWANAAAQAEKKSAFFCQPDKLILGPQNYIDIIDQQIKERSTRMTAAKLDDSWIGVLLMMGLEETFPCKGR
jgi:hypothetical protein